jgi:TRAP-type C4-dicarboxylate transport system substrate-binding protein
MKRITISLMIVPFLFSFYFVTPAQCAPIEMRIAHAYPEHTQHGRNMEFFKKKAEEYTKGQLKVTIYPSASLFPIDKEIPMLLAGTVEACYNITGPVEAFEPAEAIYNIPFLMRVAPGDSRHLQAMMKSPKVEGILVKRFEKRGIKRIGNVPTLFGFFIVANNRHPVEKLEDMKGLKIRNPGGMMGKLYLEAMGASAMTITGAETPVALNQGVVDGVTTTIVHYHDARWHTKHLTLPFYTGYTLPFLFNLKWWKGLPEDIRQAVEKKAVPELMDFAFKEVTEREKEYVDTIQKPPYNVKVTFFSNKEMERCASIVRQPAIDAFIKKIGPEGKTMVEEALRLRPE